MTTDAEFFETVDKQAKAFLGNLRDWQSRDVSANKAAPNFQERLQDTINVMEAFTLILHHCKMYAQPPVAPDTPVMAVPDVGTAAVPTATSADASPRRAKPLEVKFGLDEEDSVYGAVSDKPQRDDYFSKCIAEAKACYDRLNAQGGYTDPNDAMGVAVQQASLAVLNAIEAYIRVLEAARGGEAKAA